MSISKYSEADSNLKFSQGFLHTFDFSFFVDGFHPTAPTNFPPMNPESENFIEFYFYVLEVYDPQLFSIGQYDTIIFKSISNAFSYWRRAKK